MMPRAAYPGLPRRVFPHGAAAAAPGRSPSPARRRPASRRGNVRAARRFVCGLLWLAALTGCAASPPERYGVQSSRAVVIFREYRPPFGGQTIRPPCRMADVTTLWMPLTTEESARLAAYDGLAAGGSPVAVSVSAWLPPSERQVMREYLYRLTVSQKGVTGRVMDRAAAFLPMILAELREQGLPRELAALPLVESAFEPRAVSHAGAAGLWQLMPITARRFGLIVDASCDERFDSRKATQAALRYLRWLHGHFRDWPLALAAYNCGEGALTALLRRHGADSLAALSVVGRDAMPQETLRFVPKFVAAVTAMTAAGHLPPEGDRLPEPSVRPEPAPALEDNALSGTRSFFSPVRGATIPAMRRIEP